MINGAIRRALQVAKMRKTPAQQASSAAQQQAPVPRKKDMPIDPSRSKSAQERQRYAEGGDVWDKPRPKNLGKPKHLSSKEKASAKAAAKAAGRPYPNLVDNMRAAREDGGSVESPYKMNDKVRHALDVALSETHPKRFHHTLAKSGYADGGVPEMQAPQDLAKEVPFTHDTTMASQFDVAASQPYKPKAIKIAPQKISLPKKADIRAPRLDMGKIRARKARALKPKKLRFADGGHPEIGDALRLASRTMANMAKGIKDEGVHGAAIQQGSTSTIVKEKVPGKKAEVVYEHHAKTPTEEQVFASGGGAWTRKEGKNPAGGLNAKGRASLRAQGHDIRPPAPHPKTEKDAARRKSFCARMSGMPGPMKDDNGKPTRKALSLRAWNCRADGGRLMHQDILDALRLAEERQNFKVGGKPLPTKFTKPTGLIPQPETIPTSRRGDSNPFLKTGIYASPKPIFNDPNPEGYPTGLLMPDDPNNPNTTWKKGSSSPYPNNKPFQADLGRPDSMPFPPSNSDPLPFPPGYKEAGGRFVPYEVSGRRSERMPTLDMNKVTPRPPELRYDPRPIPPKPPIDPRLPAGYGYDPRGKRSSADTFTGGGTPPAQMGDVSYYGNSVLPPSNIGGGTPPAQMGDVSYYGNSVLPPGIGYDPRPIPPKPPIDPRLPAGYGYDPRSKNKPLPIAPFTGGGQAMFPQGAFPQGIPFPLGGTGTKAGPSNAPMYQYPAGGTGTKAGSSY